MKILHAWADYGVESQALSAYGEVTRASIDPVPNQWSDAVKADGKRLPFPDDTFDLVFVHPLCTKWASTTSISGDPDDHENYIPEARAEAKRVGDHYVLENKPQAPLKDPVVFDGRMFGLPIQYERGFETSFPVEQPPRNARLAEGPETSSFYFSERTTAWWRSVKVDVVGDYPKEHLAKNVIPLPFVSRIMRDWLEAIGEAQGESDYSDYDARMETKRRTEANESLRAFCDGGTEKEGN